MISLPQLCTDALPATQAGKARQQAWHMYKRLCSVYLNIDLEGFVYWWLQTCSVLPPCFGVGERVDLVKIPAFSQPGSTLGSPAGGPCHLWGDKPASQHTWHCLCLFARMLSLWWGSLCFCCWEMLQLIQTKRLREQQAVGRIYFLFTSPAGLK